MICEIGNKQQIVRSIPVMQDTTHRDVRRRRKRGTNREVWGRIEALYIASAEAEGLAAQDVNRRSEVGCGGFFLSTKESSKKRRDRDPSEVNKLS